MKINNNIPPKLDPYGQMQRLENEQARGKVKGEAAPAQMQGDRINLSSEAVLSTTVHTVAVNTPEIRQEKVNSIKEKIANGTYTIDAKNIAKKLLQENALLEKSLGE